MTHSHFRDVFYPTGAENSRLGFGVESPIKRLSVLGQRSPQGLSAPIFSVYFALHLLCCLVV